MINLPHGQGIPIPDVPNNLKSTDPAVYSYLVDLRRNLVKVVENLVDNDVTIQNAINTGASGTFVTSGNSFVFVNGIFTSTT